MNIGINKMPIYYNIGCQTYLNKGFPYDYKNRYNKR